MTQNERIEKTKKLLEEHSGKNNPITSGQIKKELGIQEDDTNWQTRTIIEETMQTHRLPVVSGRKGYFIAETESEIDDYISDLDSRISGI